MVEQIMLNSSNALMMRKYFKSEVYAARAWEYIQLCIEF